MKLIRKVMLGIAMSPYTQVARLAIACFSCLLILDVIHMTPIDAAAFGVPEEFLPTMLVAALVSGVVVARATRFKLHDVAETNKHANGKLAKDAKLPYDKNYEYGTFIGFVVGALLGIVLATAIVPQVFINAGTWTYALTTIACTAAVVPLATMMFHFGVRWTIEKLAEKAVDVTGAVKDAMGDINEAVNNIGDIKAQIPSDEVRGDVPVPAVDEKKD